MSEHKEITSFTDVAEHTLPNTLVALDIDGTMLVMEGGVGARAWWDAAWTAHYALLQDADKAEDAALAQWKAHAQTAVVSHTDEYGLQRLLQEAREAGNTVVAVTARGWDMHTCTEKHLAALDIQMDDVNLSGMSTCHRRGIFYVGDESKGDAVLELSQRLRKDGIPLRRILFIDDVVKNVQDVSNTIDASDLVGHCYLARFA